MRYLVTIAVFAVLACQAALALQKPREQVRPGTLKVRISARSRGEIHAWAKQRVTTVVAPVSKGEASFSLQPGTWSRHLWLVFGSRECRGSLTVHS